MPVLRIDRIVSFSSEDKVHIANNILGNNTALRWKCKSTGEKHATLLLQLEKACVISGIDIGNEHSAYIEVLVSRSGDDSDFKTLLPMSSFMSAIEARQSTNINRVRMFKKEDFSKPECQEKWDRIRVVCTQPFNRHVQYGLSFIKFHTNEVIRSNESVTEAAEHIGGFRLRPDSPDNFKAGYLFAKRKELMDDKPSTVAAAIRASNSSLLNGIASSPARSPRLLPELLRNSEKRKKINKFKIDDIPLKPRHREELFYSEEDDKPNAKIDKVIEKRDAEKKKKEVEEEQLPQEPKKRENKKLDKEKLETESSRRKKDHQGAEEGTSSSKKRESIKRKLPEKNEKSPKKSKSSRITKPFKRLLEDVVLVISGIQNPDRANLRAKVLEMGSKYKPDWDSTCTHLVCAFMNTPKFHQVRGKGKIVTRQWVEECYSQKKKIPWRRFALDKSETDKLESEDEISDQIEEYKRITPEKNYTSNYSDSMEIASDTEETIERIKNSTLNNLQNEDDESLESATAQHSPVSPTASVKNDQDLYSAETDTDEETKTRKEQIKNKPFDFFKKLTFYIDNSFEDYIADMLRNYIFIHEGTLVDDPTEEIVYIICGKDEASDLKQINSNAVCILPDWIVDCHKCKQFIPPDEYFVL